LEQVRDLYELGDSITAAKILLGALAATPDDARCLALLARIRANQGALEEALAWCEKAIAADKLNPGAHYLLGAILQEGGRLTEAAASLKRALYLDQDFVLAHFALGNLRQRQGRHKESLRHFENALRALRACPAHLPLPESEGITPERLAEIIQSAIQPATAQTMNRQGER
jgi:chemotaxis protein methyltransferase CheR